MKNVKSFFTGAIVMFLLMTLANTAFAAQISKTITAVYNDIKITVDGKAIQPKDANGNIVEPFIADGSTYLPVRAIANAIGYDATWDGNTNTVSLSKKLPTSVSSGYSRTNPAPVGTSQTISVENYSDDYTATIKIVEVTTGDEAWNKIYEANKFNDRPADDKIYILAKIEAIVDKINNDKAVSFDDYDFKLFSAQNVEYSRTSIIEPEPVFSGQVFEGGTLTGYVAFLADKADTLPKIVYGMNYDGSGGIWFSLK